MAATVSGELIDSPLGLKTRLVVDGRNGSAVVRRRLLKVEVAALFAFDGVNVECQPHLKGPRRRQCKAGRIWRRM